MQRRHNNSISNRGVGSIGTIDTPPLYLVIPYTLVITSKRRSFATFGPFLLVIGSVSFRTHASDQFPELVASENRSFLLNQNILDLT